MISILEIIFYSLNESIGVIHYQAVDMGGSMYVHTFGAYFGLAASYALTDWQKLDETKGKESSTKVSDTFAMIGIEKTSFYPVVNTPPKSLQKATKKEIVRLQQEFYDDPYGFLNNWVGSNGATVHIGLEGKAKQDHYAKYGKQLAPKMNNFMELE